MTTLFIDNEPLFLEGPPGAFVPLAEVRALKAQIAALTAERDALREVLEPFAKVGELIKPLELIAATDTYLWKQDSTDPAGQFGITLADCIEARRALGE